MWNSITESHTIANQLFIYTKTTYFVHSFYIILTSSD